jgi:hypothetical protein
MFDEQNDDLGYHRPDYSAQTMFGAYRQGMDFSGLGHDELGFVSDINAEVDQTFDPTAMSHLNGLSDYHEPQPVAQPSIATAHPNPSVTPRGYGAEETGSDSGGGGGMSSAGWAAMGEAAGMVFGVIGSVVSSSQQRKQAVADQATAAAQAELAKAEADRLRAQAEADRANSFPWGTVIAGVVVVTGIGATALILRKKMKSD